ncbi:MAG: hypothetical protein K0Q72_898 [Armatimonadetes bacterium]|nr:hypothetical protein [Armatimonadota bacterium]
MSVAAIPRSREEVLYPESDGRPTAGSTSRFRWIESLQGSLDHLLGDDRDVFLASDLTWYPVEGYPVEGQSARCAVPDVMLVFGRPKGDRDAHIQHREDGISPQVVFEVVSPEDRLSAILRKLQFYQEFGVEEYYLYDPTRRLLDGYLREGNRFTEIPDMDGWVSPRLEIRFAFSNGELELIGRERTLLLSYRELVQ